MSFDDKPEINKEEILAYWKARLEKAKLAAPYFARLHSILFNALKEAGFNEEQAVEIVIAEISNGEVEDESGDEDENNHKSF